MEIIIFIIATLVAVWVFKDGEKRYPEKSSTPGYWALGTFLILIIVFPLYLVFRPKNKKEVEPWNWREKTGLWSLKDWVVGGIALGFILLIVVLILSAGKEASRVELVAQMIIPASEPESTQTPTAEIKTEQTRKVSETEYKKEMRYIEDNLLNSLNTFVDLINIKPHPKLWTNKEKQLLIFHIFLLQELYPYAKELEPPVKFKEVHDLYLASLKNIREAMILFEEAIDSPEKEISEKTDRAVDLIKRSNLLLERARRAYDSL